MDPQVAASSPFALAAFGLFSALALAGGLGVVFARNPIRSAIALFFHIVALAGLYLTLGAHFLGVIQLLVYAGAIVVLFVFVIMILGADAETPKDSRGIVARTVGASAAAAAILIAVGNVAFIRMPLPARPAEYGTLKSVGMYLFTAGVMPFELIGVTLVIAVVGAFAVARGQHRRPGSRGRAIETEGDDAIVTPRRQLPPGTEA